MDLAAFFFYIEYLQPLNKSSHKGQLSVNVYSLSIKHVELAGIVRMHRFDRRVCVRSNPHQRSFIKTVFDLEKCLASPQGLNINIDYLAVCLTLILAIKYISHYNLF